MKQPQILRIVVASPGDVQPERNCLEEVAAELNRGIAKDYALHIVISRWEADAFPGFHVEGPQGLIDRALHIEDCDLLVGIFWKRFGTPTSDAKSGTEHEFRNAYTAWKHNNRPQLMIYFKEKAYLPKTRAETDQWGQVLDFRREFPPEGLWWTFNGKPQFEKLLRNHLTLFIQTISNKQEEWIIEGKAYHDLKRYKEALTAYDQAIRLGPDHAPAYLNKGDSLYSLKRYEEALAAYDQAIRLDSNYAAAHVGRSNALRTLERYEEALNAADQAICLDSNYAAAQNVRGNALRNLERYEEALTAYDQAIRLDSNYAHPYNNKSVTLRTLERYEEALNAADQAIRLDPSYAHPYNSKSAALNSLKRYEEALTAADQAIRLDPNNTLAYRNKSLALRKLGREEEAVNASEKARQLG